MSDLENIGNVFIQEIKYMIGLNLPPIRVKKATNSMTINDYKMLIEDPYYKVYG